MVPTRVPIAALALVAAAGVLITGCATSQPSATRSGNTVTTSKPAPSSTELAAPTSTMSVTTAPSTAEPTTATLISVPVEVVTTQTTRCNAAVLAAKVQHINPGAGQRRAQFVVTNTGTGTCTLYGYGGFALVGANGKALPTNLKRVGSPGPNLVSLAPGRSAAMNLRWSVVPDGSESDSGPCEPTAAGIESIPPDETEPMHASWDFGQVCAAGSIDGSAFYPV